jgi:hypothetical protein
MDEINPAGRPPTYEKKNITIALRVTNDLYKRINEVSCRDDRSVPQTLRRWIKEKLSEQE